MKKYQIALLPGDGVGPELIASAQKVLETVGKFENLSFHFTSYSFAESAFHIYGDVLPPQTERGVRCSDAALLGAVSSGNFASPIGTLRRRLNLYADLRPIKSWDGAWSLQKDIDMVCIRENTEGFLADRNLYQGSGEWMPNPDQVLSLRVISREKCERIARFAFSYARRHGRKKITVLHKSGVLKMGDGLFLEAVRHVAETYPELILEDEYIDNAANRLISCPQKYDVILTTNLFGDIISDEASALVSNLVPTANIGDKLAVFLPVNHQHRPELAGLHQINPLPTFVCAEMLLSFLKESSAANRVRKGILYAIQKGALSLANTDQVTDLVCFGIA